jgi:D-alanine-D-alanine ligase
VLEGLLADLGERLVVKHPTQGSSFGVFMAEGRQALHQALESVLETSPRALVEKRLAGRELTCGVLAPGQALPPTEILPPEGRFFDTHAKYTPGLTREVTPPEGMPSAWIEEVQTLAREVHRGLGLEGMSRSDFIVSPEGRATILEVNTLPGMTETSILPVQARVAGIPVSDLVDRIVDEALSRARGPVSERKQAEP